MLNSPKLIIALGIGVFIVVWIGLSAGGVHLNEVWKLIIPITLIYAGIKMNLNLKKEQPVSKNENNI